MKSLIFATLLVPCFLATSIIRADSPATQPAAGSPIDLMAKQMNDAQARIEQQITETRSVIDSNQDILRDASGRLDVAPDHLNQVMAGWDDQLDTLEIDLDAARAKMDALKSAVDETQAQAQKSAENDEAVRQLNIVVADQKQSMAELLQQEKVALVSHSQVIQAEAQLAQAQAQVALERERVVAANGGDTIAALRKEMIHLQIGMKEQTARRAIIRERRERMSHVLGNLQEMEAAQAQLKLEEADLSAVRANLEHLLTPDGSPR